MSYYHTYRPQRIQDLDLVSARIALTSILKSGEFAHAYLFAGPKGTGKTSSARILAKVLNCEKNRGALEKGRETGKRQPLTEPCGECEGCRSVVAGTNMAVLEMDAASNRGIDDIRQLRERVGLAPAVGLFTVYVIDEVHMLTTEAFNALLKTLEEPPEHAIFVLCTTEDQKIPGTVASRCTVVRFTQASTDEVVGSLKKAVAGEGLDVADEVLMEIAKRADGSFRDGIKVLEQAALEGTTVTLETIDRITGYAGVYAVEDLAEALLTGQVQDALTMIAAKEKEGVDFSLLGLRLVTHLRNVLRETVVEKADAARGVRLAAVLDILVEAVSMTKVSPVASVPLEVAVMEIAQKLGYVEPDGGIPPQEKRAAKKSELNTTAPKPAEQKKQTPVEERVVLKTEKPETPEEKNGTVKIEAMDIKEKTEHETTVYAGKAVGFKTVSEKWDTVMQVIKPRNHSLEALLRSAKPVSTQGNWLDIEVYYTFHKEQLEQERHRKIIEEVISEVVGDRVHCRFSLGKRAKAAIKRVATEVDNVTGSVEDEELALAAEEIFG